MQRSVSLGMRAFWLLLVPLALAFQTAHAQSPGESEAVNPSEVETAETATSLQPPAADNASSTEETPRGVTVQAAKFSGVVPGKTTAAEVQTAWGEPAQQLGEEAESERIWIYQIKPFRRVVVNLVEARVRSLIVELEKPATADGLAQRLQLAAIVPVEVVDASGAAIGQAFPERGVVFSYAAPTDSKQVDHILLETVSAVSFVQRAESRWRREPQAALADLATAIELDPESPQAYGVRAAILWQQGMVAEALAAANQALEIQADDPDFRLVKAQALVGLGQQEEAMREIKAILAGSEPGDLVVARAMTTLANVLATGRDRKYQLATKIFTEAIRLADPLAGNEDAKVRRSAKDVLVEAHLGVAYSIGWGNWKQKDQMVPRWLDRAQAFAGNRVNRDGGSAELLLTVAQASLAAHAGFEPIDPAAQVTKAQELAAKLLEKSTDAGCRQRIGWKLGEIFLAATELAVAREDAKAAMNYGQQAREQFEAHAAPRQASLLARYQLGRVYYLLGATQTIHLDRHEEAVDWYGKAAPLLAVTDRQLPTDEGRLGEALVTMGVSFWEAGLRQQAVEVTEQGANLMRTAVVQGTLQRKSLDVPFGNLASMRQALGHERQAKGFQAIAEKNQTLRR